MKLSRNVLNFILSIILVLNFICLIHEPMIVHADPVGSDDEVKSSCGLDDDAVSRAKSYYLILKNDGYSDAAIAAILGNSVAESHINPLSDEGGVNGGLFGFTPMTNFSNSSFNKNCTHTKSTAGGQSVCSDGSCQLMYMLSCLDSAFSSYKGNLTKYNNFIANNSSEISSPSYDTSSWSGTPNILRKVPELGSINDFKSVSDPVGGAAAFVLCYERAAGIFIPCGIKSGSRDWSQKATWHTVWNSSLYGDKTGWDFFIHEFDTDAGRMKYANNMYSWITGSTFTVTQDDINSANNIAQEMVNSSLWSEDDLAAYKKLIESDLTCLVNGRRADLSQSEVENLANWERNINNNTSDSGAIHYLRIFVMFMGIILIVWSVMVYLSYWFDRINNFIDLDLLGILTFNKLHISDTEEECTFHLKTLGKTDKKTVNHRAVCIVCITGICFGTLIVSGTLYRLLNSFINLVLRILGTV